MTMNFLVKNFLRFFVVLITLMGCQVGIAQENGIPFPKPTLGFKPKVNYEMSLARSWGVVTSAINENQITIENASKDTNQITTGFRIGPSDGGGLFSGKLISQYRFVVALIPISSSQTQIKVNVVIQMRRLAATLSQALAGNNALSDVSWIDETASNPAAVAVLQDWLYEQIEQKELTAVPTTNPQPAAVSIAVPNTTATMQPATGSIEAQLERLNVLRRNKTITDAEYKAMRAKALGL